MNSKKYICGIFGFPIHHSASPAMHNPAFRHLSLDGIYLPFEVSPHLLKKAVESIRVLGLRGINVTIPYKEKVLTWLDQLSPEAKLVGAVNTIVNREGRLVGYNTDAPGFEWALKESWGRSLKGAHVVLAGAGGAARAVAVQSGISGAGRLAILNRGKKRLHNLIKHLQKHFPKMEVIGYSWNHEAAKEEVLSSDCVINATSLGMEMSDPMPVNPQWFDKKTYIFDLIYNPFETEWIREALIRGCRAQGGMGMLLYQGALAFEIWTGQKPPIEIMRKALIKYLRGLGGT